MSIINSVFEIDCGKLLHACIWSLADISSAQFRVYEPYWSNSLFLEIGAAA